MSQAATCRHLTLCSRGDVEPGTAIRIEKDGLVLAVFNVDGEFHVTDDACTHGPGSLSEGCITGHVVECDYGCGAHSDTPVPAGTGSPLYVPYDDGVLDLNT